MSHEKNELNELLLSMDFSEKEASVYLAILALGRGTASQIARAAHIHRTTVYEILGELFDKGLVTLSGREPKQEYVAEAPENLKNFLAAQLQKKKEELENAENLLIPQLKAIHNTGNRPKVMFYEGSEGLQKVYEDTLSSHEPIRAYATYDDMQATLPGYFPDYFFRRAQKGIAIRAIFPYTKAGIELSKDDKVQMRETAMIPADKYYFSPEINIYDNKVMIASWKEKLGIIIESSEIADAMKTIYELAWAEAKRLESKIEK
ncbi:MAG: hypothetical protein M3M85_04175 [bacterium]|nr:hypothetical protein [bacterium]